MSQDPSLFYEAKVDVKKLSQFLGGQFNPTKVICSEYLIHFHVCYVCMCDCGHSCGDGVLVV